MPRRKAHAAIGVGSAIVAGQNFVSRVPNEGQFMVVAGLVAGGLSGGRLPDALEPAGSPNHRDAFHSLAAGCLVLWVATKRTPVVVDLLLALAADLRSRRCSAARGDRDRAWRAVREQACYFAIGFIVGLETGYLSHLAADALTPDAVPLLARHIV